MHVCLSVCLARVLPSSPVTCDCCVSWTEGEATALPSLLVRSLLPPLPATLAQARSPLPTCPVSTEPPEPASGLGLGVRGTPGPAGTSFSPAWASGPGLAELCLLLNPPLRPGLHWWPGPALRSQASEHFGGLQPLAGKGAKGRPACLLPLSAHTGGRKGPEGRRQFGAPFAGQSLLLSLAVAL